MKILSAEQLKAWDDFTIKNEPISSIDLMERAAGKVTDWLLEKLPAKRKFAIFCGSGNNGGDGLAVARQLYNAGVQVSVYLLHAAKQSFDFTTNFHRLRQLPVEVITIASDAQFPIIGDDTLVVEALFGTGINRPVSGFAADLVQYINSLPNPVVSIDLPAGLFADEPSQDVPIIKAAYTLTFQAPKAALFFAENEIFTGEWQVLDIGLHPDFEPQSQMEWVLNDSPWLGLKKYRKHAHKGILGHAMIVAGSQEKMGAAVMSAKACLSSGAGLLTMAVPERCFGIVQTITPEAMCRPQEDSANEFFMQKAKINAVGIGPGWGETDVQAALLEELILNVQSPLLIDATALYHLSKNISMLNLRPKGFETVLTPHIGEFARLFGSSQNSFQRLETAIEKAKMFNVVIVLKGAFTQVITPGGMVYFNSTGNQGMAKGGSGDVLTGLITGLLAQRYPATLACILGVYAHGLAGDFAAEKYTPQAMTAIDIYRCLPKAWKKLARGENMQ